MHLDAKASHVGSSLSCVDILKTLYFDIMKIDPKAPRDADRDIFILSKGHAASALYATLAHRGFFPLSALDEYGKDDKRLPCHASKECMPGIEISTGSLGHGLPIGLGMALSFKHDKRHNYVYVLLSDGECDEGSNWEAALFASHHKLDNVVVVIDYNKIQALGRTNEVLNLEPLADKWKSFGWGVKEVDGHSDKELKKALSSCPIKKGSPSVVIAHTIKGKGVSFMEDKLLWHYKSPTLQDYEAAIKELK